MAAHYLHMYIITSVLILVYAQRYEGDVCTFQSATGTCRKGKECDILKRAYDNEQIKSKDIESCGFTLYDELVCCPNSDIFRTTTNVPTEVPPSPPKKPERPERPERVSERACKEYKNLDIPSPLLPHIFDGSSVQLGEYPHMVAVGLAKTAGNTSTLEFSCGGTLIHEKFVLTAAHCVTKKDERASIVRLGTTHLVVAGTSNGIVEREIARVYVHPFYSVLFKMHDIAVLELSEPVKFTTSIRPACLYTNIKDPSPDEVVSISGFGRQDDQTRSKVLLKSRCQVQNLTTCQRIYGREQVHLIPGHMCATESKRIESICDGSSGSPLSLLLDNFFFQTHFVVGIVQAGFTCTSNNPLLLTRVAFYLDYIEKIVWPNNEDNCDFHTIL